MADKRRVINGMYSVYDITTDELVFMGTVRELCSRFDITKSNVVHAVKENRIVRRKYRIYYDED